MRRRDFGAALAAVFASRARLAAAANVPHLAYLWLGSAGSDGPTWKGLQAGLRGIGYREGRDIVVDRRYAGGSEERLASLAATAIAEQPALIVTPGTVVTGVVAKLTRTIPIVSVSSDPVGSGFIQSLARPGGNITGMTVAIGPEIAGKWLELLAQAVPRARHFGMLINAANLFAPAELVRVRGAAQRLGGFTVADYPVRSAAELPAVLARIKQENPDGLIVDNDPLLMAKLADIVAATAGLPGICGNRQFSAAGGLISYGADIFEIYRRLGSYIERILQGAKPGDLPIEQPTKFGLVINMKTASTLGLTVPPLLVAQADEVIE